MCVLSCLSSRWHVPDPELAEQSIDVILKGASHPGSAAGNFSASADFDPATTCTSLVVWVELERLDQHWLWRSLNHLREV